MHRQSYIFNVAYGVGKAALDRLTRDMAIELRPEGVACLSLWPGQPARQAETHHRAAVSSLTRPRLVVLLLLSGIVLTERMAWLRAQDRQQWRDTMGLRGDDELR